jgi:hypothetical protein
VSAIAHGGQSMGVLQSPSATAILLLMGCKGMSDKEQKLLVALVLMVNQYLDDEGNEVDSRSMSAREHAIKALAEFGLMEDVNTRFGRWTDAGRRFRRDDAGISDRAQVDSPRRIVLIAKPQPKE